VWRYLAQRLLRAIGVVLGVLTIVFILVHLTGDPTAVMVPADMSRADAARLRAELGLDKPLAVQYATFLRQAAVGNFGVSFLYQVPALSIAAQRLPATVELALVALTFGVLSGVVLGISAATHHKTWADSAVMMTALLGQAVPNFWLGIILILLLAVRWHVFPTTGYGGLSHLVLPAFTLSLDSLARLARLTRSSMLEVLGQDYLRTARAAGLPEWRVVYRCALKNALLVPLTMTGLELGTLLGGAVVVETIFAWPGMGRLAISSILARDFPVVLAVVFLAAIAYVTVNLAVDVLYSFVDPRVRLG